jgi:hypothetical protein
MLSREGLRRELEREWVLLESAEKKVRNDRACVASRIDLTVLRSGFGSARGGEEEGGGRVGGRGGRAARVRRQTRRVSSALRYYASSIHTTTGKYRFEKDVSKHFSFLPEDDVVVFNVGGQVL